MLLFSQSECLHLFSVYLSELRLKIDPEQEPGHQRQSEATRYLLLFNLIESLRYDSRKKQANVTSASAFGPDEIHQRM